MTLAVSFAHGALALMNRPSTAATTQEKMPSVLFSCICRRQTRGRENSSAGKGKKLVERWTLTNFGKLRSAVRCVG
ncbi:unnamed protein product [Ectocarpus sp. CCAP 1310/34]|nr:unnamed protein product [Ectocarpus sp. CCAP 1310/34]